MISSCAIDLMQTEVEKLICFGPYKPPYNDGGAKVEKRMTPNSVGIKCYFLDREGICCNSNRASQTKRCIHAEAGKERVLLPLDD